MLESAMMKYILILLIALSLSACATKYQPMGFAGGVAAQQMTSDTYRIVSRGNGYTANTMVQDYMMLKAAETTKKAGGTHFRIITASDASRTDTITTASTSHTSFVGSTAYTTYQPGMTQNIFKPGQDAYIRVLTFAPGKAPKQGVVSADEIIQFVGSRIERG
jgi:hypothetical protein